MFELLIAVSASLLSVVTCHYLWKKSGSTPLSSRIPPAVLLLPLPLWLFSFGAEFGTTYFLIAFSLSGLVLTITGRDRKPGKLDIPARKHQDKEIFRRRLNKTAAVIAALVLPTITSFLLLMSLPQLMAELTANLIVTSIFLMLLVWPILMIWMVSSRSRFTPPVVMLVLSLIAAMPLVS